MRKVIRVLKTPVTLLLLLAILGYGAYWGYQQVTVDTTRPETACVMQDVGNELSSDRISVRVLNGGEQGGAAKTTRFALLSWGYHIVSYNNSDRDVDQVTIVGNAADDPEVKLVAQAFKAPVVTEGDGRVDHVVDVILPTRFGMVDKIPTSIPVDGPVCLPAITAASSASASPDGTSTASSSSSPTATSTKKK
ncbi:LytR C-terminal domain-containing protein [Propionicimonas sp.]|uniref:LytR C-terminal domain-containing protein n=1 Tax=Propionicimonas sp. TaxID=1955623 RepID=UPI0039E47FDC